MRDLPMTTNQARRGSALAVAFSVLLLIGALLLISSDQVLGVNRLQAMTSARQKAVYAAEAVAAMKEIVLVDLAASNDLAGLDSKPSPNYGAQWFGDCLVRWRIEPVRLQTGTDFTVNPTAAVDAVATGMSASYKENTDVYSYRIATEAFALADPDNGAGNAADLSDNEARKSTDLPPARAPWHPTTGASERTGVVQTSRIVQLKLNSLFKYAIFYASEGPTGDIELHPGNGATMKVAGAVHSNGAIYLAGGNGNGNGLGGPPPNDGGGAIFGGVLSGLGRPTTVVGVDGVFRMVKFNNLKVNQLIPFAVPPGALSALNGIPDDNTSKFLLNDIPLTRNNDSRSHRDYVGAPANNRMADDFGPFVRDGNRGASVVKTLNNIPELAGRPFEMQKEAPTGSFLAVKAAGDSATDPTKWTITPQLAGQQVYYLRRDRGVVGAARVEKASTLIATHGAPIADLYYAAAPADGIVTRATLEGGGQTIAQITAADPTVRPVDRVLAKGMPLFSQDTNGNGLLDPGEETAAADVAQPSTASGAAASFNAAFNRWLRNGHYVEKARVDSGGGRFGLNVRGRSIPDSAALTDAVLLAMTTPPVATDPIYNDPMVPRSFSADMVQYLRSRYVVHVGPHDVTALFFPTPSAVGTGLSATYFDNINFTGATVVRTDATVDFDFGNGSPDPAIGPEQFSARWTGQIAAEFGETYTFFARSDDGVRLTIDGQVVINDFTDQSASDLGPSGTIVMTAGKKVDILLEWYENSGEAEIHLKWQSPSMGIAQPVVVPQVRLFPPVATATTLLAFESRMLNRREAYYMQGRGYPEATATAPLATAPANYQINVLTLNVDRVQDWLRTTLWSAIDTTFVGTDKAKDHFNGLIYVARHRRDLNGDLDGDGNAVNDGDGFFHPVFNPGSTLVDPSPIAGGINTPQDAVFHDAVRLAQAERIDWGGTVAREGGGTRRAGLTVVTPNHCYLLKDFNLIPDSDPAVSNPARLPALSDPATAAANMRTQLRALTEIEETEINFPPCAVFADDISVQSSSWIDQDQPGLIGSGPPAASETWYHLSLIVNNLPTDATNAADEGSGGTHNVLRFLENWDNVDFHVRGSLVVMNRMRYSRGRLGASASPAFYVPPRRDMRFNTDLLARSGQPPFAPFGVQVIRNVSTIVPIR